MTAQEMFEELGYKKIQEIYFLIGIKSKMEMTLKSRLI